LLQATSLIETAVGRPEVFRRVAAHRITERWDECVGAQLGAKSTPDKFENGTLWVAVTAPVWVQELRMRKQQILERLNEWAGEELFKDVRFGVRSVEKPTAIEATGTTKEPLTIEEIDVEFTVPEIEAIARPVLGKMKAARKRDK
jgi:predicted nucleic acid-binding Zn ribbon protein